jgi:polysaccharide deacetylase family protein (PEP-CTERM system associated)
MQCQFDVAGFEISAIRTEEALRTALTLAFAGNGWGPTAKVTLVMPSRISEGIGRAALSIDVEDWFQTENLKTAIAREDWGGCDLRVERNTRRILEILASRDARATFFVLGWVAEKCPRLVREIAAAGHEIASHGYGHDLVYTLSPKDFRRDVLRSKDLLEDLIGSPIHGYRAPCFSITDWATDILQEVGFTYDSSAFPTIAHDRYGRLDGVDACTPIVRLRNGLYEICVSCLRLGRQGIPWGGGGYFRLIPYVLWRQGIRAIRRSGLPYVFYLHPWEIDPGQPAVEGVRASNAFRQRVNLRRCEGRFAALVRDFAWVPLRDLIPAASALDVSAADTRVES